MSSPRDRDGADDGNEWQEPPHLSGSEPEDGSAEDRPNIADRRMRPRDGDPSADRETWQPPGWDLPPATPGRQPEVGPSWSPPPTSSPPPVSPPPATPVPPDVPGPFPSGQSTGPVRPPGQEPVAGGFFGPRRRPPGEVEQVFRYEGDVVGAQGWALQHGWTISDGDAPEDAVLRELVASAPVRPTKDHRPASVLRGRAGTLDLVAFDIVYASGRYLVPQYAVTAAPLLGAVPGLRLSPARFWKHRIAGLLPIPSGDEHFDTRWMLLAAEDSPQVRRLAQDPAVHALLLGTDDGDEFWTAAGHLAAIRPDGHRPSLLEHHARLLNALVAGLSIGS